MVGTAEATPDFFRSRCTVSAETGCWVWTGRLNATGHAQIEVGGVLTLVHRACWQANERPLVRRQPLLRTCQTPGCINPDHHIATTRREFFHHLVETGKHLGRVPEWGCRKPRIRKLTPEMVAEIRATTISATILAKKFGVCRTSVWAVRNGKSKRDL